MKILITGGAGFIGSHVAEYFFKKNSEVFIVDNLSSGYRENVPFIDHHHFFDMDIRAYSEMEQLIKVYQFDVIIHLAAVVSVVETVEKPEESNDVNVSALVHLLEICRKFNKNLKKFVFASSAAVYGNEKTLPKSIESSIQPESPYAIQKYSGEQYVKIYNSLYHLPTTALRFFNVFGPRQDPKSQYSGVLSIMKNSFDENKKFTFFGDGKQTRDFVYVKDIVQAVDIVIENNVTNGQVYNVATSNQISLLDIYDIFVKLYQKEIETTHAAPRDGDVKHSYADIEPLRNIGYRCNYSLMEGLKAYLEYESNL
ncbi:NAD-dependent epimerase/dehydratase family protein [Staphylococcus lutrae]|uniref:NAD-dependent dehydratase n=1 Tax=Staphylococcus lutrae TaxID=155085 RepID=A0AAC9WJ54_9STAP|nr:NAD-dependent epimerase/dehydratase family protein [Staphylococcus lutrae]ARJ50643.1 NAD-dependent dehydratase [Staphylococcus lutrae]PNZ39137.1 NAD-dependent dehydratase [Staphylococcus lutrae]